MIRVSKYDIFISYASEDTQWVKGYLLDALQQANIKFITEEAFTVGAPRLTEFERAVKESARTLLVLSPAYLAENFTQFIDLLAQSYGLETATWPVLPLVLKTVDLPTRLAMLTSIDATDQDEWNDVISRLVDIFQYSLPETPEIPDCPYPGMMPFSEADSTRFFGRDDEVQEMLERLRLHPFLTVIGPSGSGKSSLVYAGLLPALRESKLFGKSDWQISSMRPGETPLTTLNTLIPSQTGRKVEKTLLFIDQFEEVFTLAGDEAAPFQEALQGLIEFPNIYLILTMRADFYADLMASSLWEQIKAHRLEVAPLGSSELRNAIVRPAENAGVFIEAALIERLLVDATGEPGILPLIQETLVLMWEQIERRFLPLRAYTALVLHRQDYGEAPRTGLQVAIARRGDAALAELPLEEQAIAQRIFLRLIQFGDGRTHTRRQQSAGNLLDSSDKRAFDRTLNHFIERRLLTSSGGELEEERSIDIAHEALIQGWPRLSNWIQTHLENEKVHRRLEGKAADWKRLGMGAGGLLDQIELLELKRWEQVYGSESSQLVQDFLNASKLALKKTERSKRLRSLSIIGLYSIALVIAVLGVTGWFNPFLYRPGQVMEDYWVDIPAGEFWMGSLDTDTLAESDEGGQVKIYMDAFQIGHHEITNEQWNQCVRANTCKGTLSAPSLDLPVVSVSWQAANDFCAWAGGRLPTEAEWEKAARGGILIPQANGEMAKNPNPGRIYPWGDETPRCELDSPFGANTTFCGYEAAISVKSFSANPYGLYDMAGNVWEWVADWYDKDYTKLLPHDTNNPLGPVISSDSIEKKALRGGSWDSLNDWVRTANREGKTPTDVSPDIGFRCAR